MYGYISRFRRSVIYVCKERKFMETLINAIRWFVEANYMIIGMLDIATMIAFVETTKVGDDNE